MRRSIFKTGLVFIGLLIVSCGLASADDGYTEDFHSSYAVSSGGRLHVSNRNGSLDITGWDRNTVDIAGTKYAPQREELRDVKVDMNQSGDSIDIRTRTPDGNWWHGGNYGVRFRIRVPRRFLLDRVETTNGSITAEDIEGGGYIKSTNGKLLFSRLTGDYHFETTNGGIEMGDCTGSDRAETTNGRIQARMKSGSIEASSTNGAIEITVLNPRPGKPLRLSTTNGSVTLAMAEFRDNPIHAETTHGSVTLRLPENLNGRLDASTSMASVSSSLPLSSTEDQSRHHLRGRFGSGGPDIEVTTTTGGIRIERY